MPLSLIKLAAVIAAAAAAALGFTSQPSRPRPKVTPSAATITAAERAGAQLLDGLASGRISIDAAEIDGWRSVAAASRATAIPRLKTQLARDVRAGELSSGAAADLLAAAQAALSQR